jgi:hypothetical protein
MLTEDEAPYIMIIMSNKPYFWPTWAVGALFRGVRRIHINHVCDGKRMLTHIFPACSIEESGHPYKGSAHGGIHLKRESTHSINSDYKWVAFF